MILTEFGYAVPGTLAGALELLARPGARALAGGQSLLVDLTTGEGDAGLLVDLREVAEHEPGLRGVHRRPDGGLTVGALTTLAELARDPAVRAGAAVLAEAAGGNGDPQVRNRGTVGGNLAATGRATDLPAAALAVDASVRLAGPGGERLVTADRLAADGVPPGHLVTALDLPAPPEGGGAVGTAYAKAADRASRYPRCGVGVWLRRAADGTVDGCRIAVTGATVRPVRLRPVEERLRGGGAAPAEVLAAFRAGPGAEFTAGRGVSAEYLAHLAAVLTARALHRAVPPP